MTLFQTLSVIFSVLLLLGAIVGVYVKSAISIAKIEVEIIAMRHDLLQKEFAITNIEKNNREDFKEINGKLDKLVDKIYQNT